MNRMNVYLLTSVLLVVLYATTSCHGSVHAQSSATKTTTLYGPAQPVESTSVQFDRKILVSIEANLLLVQQQLGIKGADGQSIVTDKTVAAYNQAKLSYNAALKWLDYYHTAISIGVKPDRSEQFFHNMVHQAVLDVERMEQAKGRP